MRKDLIVATLGTFCLTITLFTIIPIRSQTTPEYDPWKDINDDGYIGIDDIVSVAENFGALGTPINKTALLLELQSKVESLNASVLQLLSEVASLQTELALLKTDFADLNASLAELQSIVETRIPKKGYISVPAAAFVPYNNTFNVKTWDRLLNYENVTVSFFGSIQLPHGAIVKNVTFYWYDVGEEDLMFRLVRYRQGMGTNMVQVFSSGSPGWGSTSTNSITSPTVDNNLYAYHLYVSIPASSSHTDYRFNYAVIEYEYSA